MKWLLYFWPQKIFIRTFLLVSLIMLLSYLAAIILFVSFFKNVALIDTAKYVSREVVLIRSALRYIPNEEKLAYLISLKKENKIQLRSVRVSSAPPGVSATIPFQRLLHRHLGDQTENRFQRVAGRIIVWTKFKNVKPNFWLGLSLNKSKQKFGSRFVLQLLVILVLSVLGVFWIAYRLKKPFKRLIRAAKSISLGLTPDYVPLTGPKEVKQLTQAFNKMGEDIDKREQERVTMLAGISHDLRTPLSRMRLAIEMIEQKECSLQQSMIKDVEDMDAIVGQFLAYAKKDRDELTEIFSLNDFVDSLVNTYQQQGRDIVFSADSMIKVEFNQLSLHRMLMNLIDNAIQYGMEPIKIRLVQKIAQFELSVSDSGLGVAADELENICLPFERGSDCRSNAIGSGLGLAIVKGIAEKNKLDFKIYNSHSGGLTVSFKLYRV